LRVVSEAAVNETLLANLNDAQKDAVLHYDGPALVIAGAGSGKTRTVVQRIAYLMAEHEVFPTEILAVTFTNKAAGELKERVQELIGAPAKDLWVSTFHSACLRVLRTYGELIGLQPGFVIYDTSDQLDVLQDVMERVHLKDANPRVLRAIIDRAKSNLWSADRLAQEAETTFGSMIAGLRLDALIEGFRLYQAKLKSSNAVDFNDILMRTVELFDEHPDVLDKVQQRAVFIHVDEYQDTNTAQYRLTHQLASKYHNLMVVGDPDQSIYAFRGADVRNILDFKRDYQDADVYRLELNYRSVGSVLSVANALIQVNAERLEKTLTPVKGEGSKVKVYRAHDQRNEADFVARQIESVMAERDLGFNDIAVLYRTNAQSRVLEESLRRASIPSKIIGGVGFYERREVKDILSYARAALNPTDDVSLRRILNRPKRGIGKTSEDNLNRWAVANNARFVDALRQADDILKGTPAVKRIAEFVEMMDDLSDAAVSLPAGQFLKSVFDQSGYLQALKDENSFDAQGRLENLDELLNAIAEWEKDVGGTVGEFLDEAALLASVDDRAVKAVNGEVADEAVTLMTLHNAKGLEFPVVFLVGLEENLMPHRSSTGSLQEIEEERRLLYVGITRAQEALFLVHSESRMTFGRSEFARPSRFFDDVPKDLLEDIDILGQPMQSANLSKFGRDTWRPPRMQVSPANTNNANSSVSAKDGVLRGGEKVTHPKFGKGTVVGVSGQGPRAEITVVFEDSKVGAKKLALKYANLTPIA